MSWSPEEIRDWLLRCADRMEAAAPELNEFDGRPGDGDLGATLEKCAIQMRTGLDGEFSRGRVGGVVTELPPSQSRTCAH